VSRSTPTTMLALTDDEMRDYWLHSLDFPLTSIRDDEHLDRAIARVDALIDQDTLSDGDEVYLNALSDLIALYESAHVTLPRVSGVNILRHLMEARDLEQKDLVPLLGNTSTVPEVLSGKRRLTMAHIKRLSSFFHVPADVFID